MNVNPRTKGLARQGKRNLAPAEKILWKHLRGRRFMDFKFRRQHPIGPYIADFARVEIGLVLELDGESHLSSQTKDATRTKVMEEWGWVVLRLWNTDVFDNTEAVLEKIFQECERLQKLVSPAGAGPHPRPLSQRERGAHASDLDLRNTEKR